MLVVDAALAHDAQRRRPEARREAGVADFPGQGCQTAREFLVRFEPVADRALVAIVELDDLHGDLVARLGQGFEVAQQVGFGDVVEEVVPAAPTR